MSELKSPEYYMELAIQEARAALHGNSTTEPEVPVGCVFVNTETGEVLGVGHNQTNRTCNATRHAELVAIDDMLVRQSLPVDIIQSCNL